MATSMLCLVVLVLSLAAAATARPCKTLFFVSTTTSTAYYPYNSLSRNPNLLFRIPDQGPRHLTFIFSSTAGRFPAAPHIISELNRDFDGVSRSSSTEKLSDLPLKLYSSVSSSIRDRSVDIMSVVGALLFGVGCGGITAAVLYLFWAFFSSAGRFDFDDVSSSSSSDDDYDDDDVDSAKKKLGYVVIPSQPKVVDDDLKKPAPLAEVV